MEVFDVSQGIVDGMPVWPGDPVVEVTRVMQVSAGDVANVSQLRLGTHTGTHVDAPAHFFDGAATADALPLDALIGDALVVDVAGEGPLGPRELEAIGRTLRIAPEQGGGAGRTLRIAPEQGGGAGAGPGVVRLLLRTGGWPDGVARAAVGLSADGASWLVGQGIRLVGIDAPSIEAVAEAAGDAAPAGHPVHEILLTAGIVILEGLVLTSIVPGRYELVCLPLKVVGGDGAPARAVLVRR
ncbi:MAG TPA: cyclase family protein [Actinomycetota bacterium]